MGSVPFLFIAALWTLNPVTVSVYPYFAMRPATFRITVFVPRHAENRYLCYDVRGPEDKRSCFTLHGAADRRSWTVYWELRTAGDYTASAVLTRMEAGRETTYRDEQAFAVFGMAP